MPYSERNEPEKLRDGRYHRNKYHDGGTEQSRSYDEFIHAAPLLEYRKVRAAVIDVNDSRKPHDEKSHCLRNGKARLFAAAQIAMPAEPDGYQRCDRKHDRDLYDLGDQARKLFDDELLENNPRDEYFKNLKEDISEYHDKNKTIASSAVDSSNDVEYKEVDGDDCAYVKASYFIKEGNAYSRTYQMYVLRKDADGNWKILVFYQVNGDSSDDE